MIISFMGWINVNDKLPEKNEKVLLYATYCCMRTSSGKINPQIYIGYMEHDECFIIDYDYDIAVNITHWMPLPKFPITEDKNEVD